MTFNQMVRSMFTRRRKTLANALAAFAAARRRESREALSAAGIDPSRRAETLQMSELARLADVFAGPAA
jgi:16S rRNA (adenine1518-N6/adenine1519-N6)-dimethyltransferase